MTILPATAGTTYPAPSPNPRALNTCLSGICVPTARKKTEWSHATGSSSGEESFRFRFVGEWNTSRMAEWPVEEDDGAPRTSAGEWNTLRLDVIGSRIDVWWDGALLTSHDFQLRDAVLGRFGMVKDDKGGLLFAGDHALYLRTGYELHFGIESGNGVIQQTPAVQVTGSGAVTVHVDGNAVRSCVTPVDSLKGSAVTTIEAIGKTPTGAKVQKAWLDREVVQCGYCQSGQIMSAAALLAANPKPTDADIDDAMAGNICRCGTYGRVREAIKQAAQSQNKGG